MLEATLHSATLPSSAPKLRRLDQFDIETVRVAAETTTAREIAHHPLFRVLASKHVPSDPTVVRRRLLAQALRLSDSMAPVAYQAARGAQVTLGVTGEIELYQSGGRENAAIHLVQSPILMEIQGRLLPLLDDATLRAVFGHELGHYLAHGPWGAAGAVHVVALRASELPSLPNELARSLRKLSILRELTADRVGLLACQDLHAALRLEMVATTGLSADALTWDTQTYLAQCKEVMEGVLRGQGGIYASSHPEHSLRAYAVWLFSETKEYRGLTGQGSATRSLAEVDELIRAFIERSEAETDASYHMLDEPPRELHECALAAAVVVAHADGTVSDEEREVIENVFAPLVGDWRSYLDLEFAAQRLHETAPIIVACGSDLLHSLFSLLVHVMGADGTIDASEVAAIRFIGEVLGCEEEYARRLDSTLTALQIPKPRQPLTPSRPPLPPRRGEVLDALQAFLAGVSRRGETVTTLRRVLRLLGMRNRDEASLGHIRQMMKRHRIEASADLESVDLDERLQLTAPPPSKRPSASETAELEPSRENLARALVRLRDKLVSGDGRSPSVRVRKVRKGRTIDLHDLEKIGVGRAERIVLSVREGQPSILVSPEESGDHPAAKRVAADLLALEREHRSLLEEKGAHDLYLGHPLVVGNVALKQGAGSGYTVRAPLILYPIELERHGKGAPGYRLRPRKDHAPVVNQSLLRLIFNKAGLGYAEAVSDELERLVADSRTSLTGLLDQLRTYGLHIDRKESALVPLRDRDTELDERGPFLETEECALLGIFPQSNSDLLQDYDGLLQALGESTSATEEVFGAARLVLPETLRGRAESNTPATIAPPGPPAILADPIQRRVIADCRRSAATVVDGPPGTGKSQVIVNLIADALRRGERVAVVCEKRAALDVVYQRMEGLGLRHAIGVVHDINEDRKTLFAQIGTRIEKHVPHAFEHAEAEQAHAAHREASLSLERRDQALARECRGSELTLGQLHTIAAGIDGTVSVAQSRLETLPKSDLERLLEHVTALHTLRDLWAPGTRFRSRNPQAQRKDLANATSHTLSALAEAIAQAAGAARQFEAIQQRSTTPFDLVAPARSPLSELRLSRSHRSDTDGRQRFEILLGVALSTPERLRAAPVALRKFEESRQSLERFDAPIEMPIPDGLLAAIQILRVWSSRWFRFLSWSWWKARSSVRVALLSAWPDRAGETLNSTLIEDLQARLIASAAWSSLRGHLEALGTTLALPTRTRELGAFLTQVATLAETASTLAHSRPLLERAGAWVPASAPAQMISEWDALADEKLTLLDAHDSLGSATQPVVEFLPWWPSHPAASDLDELEAALRKDGGRLVDVDRLTAAARNVCPRALDLLDALIAQEADSGADRWRALLTAAWATAHVEQAEREDAGLSRLGTTADDHEQQRSAAKLVELEKELSELEIERILAKADQAKLLQIRPAEKGQRRTPEQKLREELIKEVGKKRRLLPLRSFVRRFAPEGLLDLVPVWLLSPETMSVLFPRQPLFDLVVFDEASQCTVEAGLPVLLRARRAVIAGDEKQMPPTSFFSRKDTTDEDSDEATEDQEERELKDMLAAESLLNLARGRVPHTGLAWHYRCLDEALIAFSNHSMYHGGLLTIPATAGPDAPSALHWVPVKNGRQESNANLPEAEVVVDELNTLLSQQPAPSVGVVTFNLRQRQAILDAIDARCDRDKAFRQVWTAASSDNSLDERPFVKNLENVQGDERDIILFSLGYAPKERVRGGKPTGELYVPARFGPVGQRGGERRLNVAISRAKKECRVIASFLPSQLTVASAKHDGPKLFKQFLEFVHYMSQGRQTQAERVLDLVREERVSPHRRVVRASLEAYTPLAVQLFAALENEGIPVALNVGSSEFRIPLAIHDPADPTQFSLAIFPDEGGNGEQLDPFDRHVHRPNVLATRNWKVMRLTAASWRRRRNEVLEEIFQMVPGARGALHTELWKQHKKKLANRTPQAVPLRPSAPARPKLQKATPAVTSVQAPPAQAPEPSAAPAEPEWLATVDNPRFKQALLHLHEHRQLNETELINLVGGPRQARAFARRLDEWAKVLPFRVEVHTVSGAKVYKDVGNA